MLTFKGDKRTGGWTFKYLSIWKLDLDCYIILGRDHRPNEAIALSKKLIEKGVDREHLNAH